MYIITATRKHRIERVYSVSKEFIPFQFEDFNVQVYIDQDVAESKLEELKQYQEVEGCWSSYELGILSLGQFAVSYG